jgi:hypothetical protein
VNDKNICITCPEKIFRNELITGALNVFNNRKASTAQTDILTFVLDKYSINLKSSDGSIVGETPKQSKERD